jgi:hypothetical protein
MSFVFNIVYVLKVSPLTRGREHSEYTSYPKWAIGIENNNKDHNLNVRFCEYYVSFSVCVYASDGR